MKPRFALCAMLAFITCATAVGQQVSVNYNHDVNFAQFHTYAWGMRGIGGGFGGLSPEQNVDATLIVDLYNAKTQSLVWRGIAQNALNNNGNKNQEMVEKAIQKMFKQWPKP